MQKLKTALMVGAGVATIGLGGLGVASAATNNSSSTSPDSSLVDKIASTFNLDKSKVQAVFDQNRADYMKEMQAKRADALKQAVTDGKITQAQADYITKAWADIEAQRPADGSKPSDSQREAIKTKRDALQTWLKQQNIDLHTVLRSEGFTHGRHGDSQGTTSGSSSSSSSSTTSSS